MNKRTTTAIPVEGDRAYATVLKILAAQQKRTISALVREALDEKYGSEMENIASSFFATELTSALVSEQES